MFALAALVFGVLGSADPHSKADLVVANRAVRPGGSFDLAVRFRMDPGWHIYWKNPGESGVPPTIKWSLPNGWKAGPIAWPTPERTDAQGIANYVYEREALLLVRMTAPATAKVGSTVPLRATVKWLCCQEACIPAEAKVERPVRVLAREELDPQASARLARARRELPATSTIVALKAWRDGKGVRLAASPRGEGRVDLDGAVFYPSDESIDPSAPQTVQSTSAGPTLALTISSYAPKPPTRLRGLLIAPEGKDWQPGLRAMAVDIPIERGSS